MAQLSILKQKLNSIKTTKKITHAIRLISMSFYSRLEKQQTELNQYKTTIQTLLAQLIKQYPIWNNKKFFPQDVLDKNPLIIIVSSAKGLCGSFNTNLFRYFEQTFLLEKNQKPDFIIIGQKAINFTKTLSQTKKLPNSIIYAEKELKTSNFNSIAKKISDTIITCEKTYSSVSFYHNFMKNFFAQKPQKTTLIPFEKKETINTPPKITDLIWEQDKTKTLDFLATLVIKSSTLDILFQSLISEHAARFLAMDSSTTNAEKFIERLTLQYNKSRQALITREVAELSTNL
jgi:F-type H+-transporting ATPase subunit gamma